MQTCSDQRFRPIEHKILSAPLIPFCPPQVQGCCLPIECVCSHRLLQLLQTIQCLVRNFILENSCILTAIPTLVFLVYVGPAVYQGTFNDIVNCSLLQLKDVFISGTTTKYANFMHINIADIGAIQILRASSTILLYDYVANILSDQVVTLFSLDVCPVLDCQMVQGLRCFLESLPLERGDGTTFNFRVITTPASDILVRKVSNDLIRQGIAVVVEANTSDIVILNLCHLNAIVDPAT